MLIGLYLIITAWAISGLPLWFSIVNTVIGGLLILSRVVMIAEEHT